MGSPSLNAMNWNAQGPGDLIGATGLKVQFQPADQMMGIPRVELSSHQSLTKLTEIIKTQGN